VKSIFPPQATTSSIIRPEWLRLPKSGLRCPISGLSRSALNAAILPNAANDYKPQVLSRQIKSNKLASRGQRLVNVASLLVFIEAQPSGFESEENPI
jgi:hypothetical protein